MGEKPERSWATVTFLDINHSTGSATIKLNYEELRDLSNLLRRSEVSTKTLNRDFFLLFDIVKNGCIDRFTMARLKNLQDDINSEKDD